MKSPGVDVGRLDGVEEQLGHAHALHVDQVGLEEGLGRLKPLAADLDDPAVRELGDSRASGGAHMKDSGVMSVWRCSPGNTNSTAELTWQDLRERKSWAHSSVKRTKTRKTCCTVLMCPVGGIVIKGPNLGLKKKKNQILQKTPVAFFREFINLYSFTNKSLYEQIVIYI